jgi:hypothetical protein
MVRSLVVIDNLHVHRARRFLRPLKADPPLVVDANAVLALSVALHGLEAVAGQCCQILQCVGGLDPVQRETGGPFKARQRLDSFPGGDISRSPVSITDDHLSYTGMKYELRHA